MLRRSSIFITFLLSLFIFQSLWNVAAAYCVHENAEQTGYHFGHHRVEYSKCDQHVKVTEQTQNDSVNTAIFQDHHDHLPTCFHVIVVESQQKVELPPMQVQIIQQHYDWSNSYQSPDLIGHHPPPVLTPLLVG